MRTATIHIRKASDGLAAARKGFLAAWEAGEYQGEHFDFESPAALFRALTPKRWELIECLQKNRPPWRPCSRPCPRPRREARS